MHCHSNWYCTPWWANLWFRLMPWRLLLWTKQRQPKLRCDKFWQHPILTPYRVPISNFRRVVRHSAHDAACLHVLHLHLLSASGFHWSFLPAQPDPGGHQLEVHRGSSRAVGQGWGHSSSGSQDREGRWQLRRRRPAEFGGEQRWSQYCLVL